MATDPDRAAAFAEFYAAVLAYARRRTDEETARDVTADTFLAAWRRFDDASARGLPWLYRAAANALRNHTRSTGRGDRLRAKVATEPESAALADRMEAGHPVQNGPAERLVAIADLYREQPVRPKLRAALLRYLAETPTLTVSGAVTDRLGRPGIAFSVTSDYSGLPTRYALIVDPRTGALLGSEETLTTSAGKLNVTIPSVIQYDAFRDSAFVDTLSLD